MPAMVMAGNIFFIGLMGSGKTTIGRALSRKLNRHFIDSDHEIEKRTGVSVPTIFEIEGEHGFRDRETEVIADLVNANNVVLATGGGAILRSENRRLLKENGTVIYLRAPVEELFARTSRDRNRPLLQTPDPMARLKELVIVRDPLYQETAHLVVDTNRQSVQQLVSDIEDRLVEMKLL